ncbi:MAG: UDP-N-acetylmuramoyl-tripeptide--D-alanyl-D-alanine ligase, partial [Thermodesulfobacteriota bacterium]
EIDRLGAISQPDVGVITNIGPAHLEGLKDTDHVMAAKAELLAHIRPEGSVLLNADDPYTGKLRQMCRSRVQQFGFSETAGCRARNLRQQQWATEFELVLPDAALEVRLPVPGRSMVANALAAAAVGHTLGISNLHIRDGLEGFRPVKGRMAHTLSAEGIHVVDDAYNANPGSMKAAVETLVASKGEGRGFLVAGDMLELGPAAASFHYEAGCYAAERGVDALYVSGDFAADYVRGATAGGMDADRAVAADQEELLKQLRKELAPGDWVLVKGSHSTGMDRIVQHIIGRETRSSGGRGD